ncbi:MAG: VWA domain-containing protein [Methylophaga sp.]|nr:VWA domain-containing protein [Methylophaga sp.]
MSKSIKIFLAIVVFWTLNINQALGKLDRDEPISYAGHGSIYDFYGNRVVPNQSFVESAQNYYLSKIENEATAAQKTEYQSKRVALDALGLSGKDRLYANYRLLKWMNDTVNPKDKSRYTERIQLLQQQVLATDTPITSSFDVIGAELFKPSTELQTSIATLNIPETIVLFSTTLGGDDYKQECEDNSVPSPPKWTSSKWDFRGDITNEFISSNSTTKVYVYTSIAPQGVCVALPRVTGSTAGLLGVICLSKVTGKACFWDNQVGGTTIAVGLTEEQTIPGPKFSGGIDLTAPGAGKCTSCHAGENPFNIHPGTALSGFDTFSNVWYKPIVNPDWAQNAGPASLIDTLDSSGDCIGCHSAGGTGGRFPEISTKIRGYCNDVLRKAVGKCTTSPCMDGGNIVLPTMPYGDPGSSANAIHVTALINACDSEPKSIIRFNEVTLNYGDVERGFSFSKGLVVHNDGNDTLEVEVSEGTTAGDFDDAVQWSEINLQTTNFDIDPGDPPLILKQTYTPTDNNTHTIFMTVTSNDPSNLSERITLTGTGADPTPIDSVLVLDRSGSMKESAGDRKKIEAMRDATNLYADLLRDNPGGETTGDKLGFVKYNDNNSDYMTFGFMNAAKRTEIDTKLSDSALTQSSSLNPEGGTGIGGAMERAAAILVPSPATRTQVLVVLTDGHETETPYINSVIDPIRTANPDLSMFSIGLGDDIEPDKLQNITNVTEGYHQVAGSLSNENLFDLETFYFKIFAEAAGMELVVDPTHAENIVSPNPIIVDTATIISSDKSATFLVLDDPLLREFYDLDFLTPTGEVIVPGLSVGGIGIQESSRHNYKIFRVVFPNNDQADLYTGDWSLRLTPNGKWDEKKVRKLLEKSEINYSGWLSPFQGTVPVGFAAAVSSDYRLDVSLLVDSYQPGATVKLTANLTDRYWPAPNGSVHVTITDPNASINSLTLFDDGSHGDTVGGDAIWTNTFSQTAPQGVYKFLFRSSGSNLRGELGPREASRYLSLTQPSVNPSPGNNDRECIPCLILRWLLVIALLLLIGIWYCVCWKKRG